MKSYHARDECVTPQVQTALESFLIIEKTSVNHSNIFLAASCNFKRVGGSR